ncbi:hypothetical protein F511_40819 [Dorcoceras hygrometricum]|uniref:Uncharacterized protein n=1 Tax=Dorcoceras hygrometricum TaxID=472368 RepID=A0A2Z7CKZ8_9LAMI|nr:hypothetical protein F511_40819 [Dorcoceras hygrometricum]
MPAGLPEVGNDVEISRWFVVSADCYRRIDVVWLIEKAGFVATKYYTNGIELRLLVVRLSSISRENSFIPQRTVDTLYLLIKEAGFEAVGVYPTTKRWSLSYNN